jgi:altronate dehydratase small subunit
MNDVVVINQADNVAVALRELNIGEKITVYNKTISIKEKIPVGFKVSTETIQEKHAVIKYGEPIGIAVMPISPGELVHIHNVQGARGRGDRNK